MYTIQAIRDLINNNIRNKTPKVLKSEHAQIEEALLDLIFMPYEVKQLDCPYEFVLENFDLNPGPNMGLGKNLALGYAISNGNNGTRNRNGRVALQFDPDVYPNLGEMGGSSDAVVVKHNHKQFSPSNTATANGLDSDGFPVDSSGGTGWGDASYIIRKSETAPTLGKTTTEGVDGAGKNMQPFIVSLFIQRIR